MLRVCNGCKDVLVRDQDGSSGPIKKKILRGRSGWVATKFGVPWTATTAELQLKLFLFREKFSP